MNKQIENCIMVGSECPCSEYSRESLCDYPNLVKEYAVHWRFKCGSCGYKFKEIGTQQLFDSYKECGQCGSKNIEKRLVKCLPKNNI